jgi:hypothetical protein
MAPSPARVQAIDLLLRAGAKPDTANLLPYLNCTKETPDFFKLRRAFEAEVARLRQNGEAVPESRYITIQEAVEGKLWSNQLIPMLFKAGMRISGRDFGCVDAVEIADDRRADCFLRDAGVNVLSARWS